MIIRTIVALALILATLPARAMKPDDITKSEMAMIPKYCADAQTFGYGDAYYNTSPRAHIWVSLMGKTFWAIHHYCWALINLGRAARVGMNPEIRSGLLTEIRGDYQFVLNSAPPNFILRPEILTRIGDVELLRHLPDKAKEAYAQARELKPDYWPAYSHWAEYLISKGQRAEAKDLVKTGLEYSPTAKGLIEQYGRLGGRLSDIVPRKIPEPVADAAADAPPPAVEGQPVNQDAAPSVPTAAPSEAN